MAFEFFLKRVGLHSHSFSVSTHLFNFFIANFIAESPQIESKQKDDFIEEWGYTGFDEKTLSIHFFGFDVVQCWVYTNIF